MGRFSTWLAGLAAVATFGGPCLAADRPADPPAPPSDASDAQLRDWITRYIDTGKFVEAGVDARRVTLYDPTTVEKLAGGHVTGWVRSELFHPTAADGQTLRSVRKKLEIDCVDWRYKELVVEGYTGANLQRPVPISISDAWTKPLAADSSAGKPLRLACAAADARR
jgi:hypothetical protein